MKLESKNFHIKKYGGLELKSGSVVITGLLVFFVWLFLLRFVFRGSAQRYPEKSSPSAEVKKEEWPLSGLNLLLARCLWDAMRQPSWMSLIANKIQAKLAAIKVS